MKFSFMRAVDIYLGSLLNLLLVPIFVPLIKLRWLFLTRLKDKPRVICLAKYLGFGSIINTIPLINEARRLYPESRLIFVSFKENKEICSMLKNIDSFFYLRRDNPFIFIFDILRFIFWAFWQKIEVFIDLEFFSHFSLMTALLSLAKRRIGFYAGEPVRRIILTDYVYYNPFRHIRKIFLALSGPLGGEIEGADVYIDQQDLLLEGGFMPALKEKAPFLCAKNEKKLILVNPNVGDLTLNRRWPREYYIGLIGKILKNHPETILYLIGSKSDYAYCESIRQKLDSQISQRCFNLSAKLSLKELAAVFKNYTRLFITNDSGPYHLASVYKVPTVVMFGPETSRLYGPLPAEDWCKVFEKDLYCVPCINAFTKKFTRCQDNRCLKDISVDEVYAHCQGLLR